MFFLVYVGFDSFVFFFFLMIRRPPRSTLDRSSAASDVYKRQQQVVLMVRHDAAAFGDGQPGGEVARLALLDDGDLSLIHISEPTRPY